MEEDTKGVLPNQKQNLHHEVLLLQAIPTNLHQLVDYFYSFYSPLLVK